MLNLEAEDGITADEYAWNLFSPKCEEEGKVNLIPHIVYSQVLHPLCWAGLLSEHKSGRGTLKDRVYIKTPLWKAALKLETDAMVSKAVRH